MPGWEDELERWLMPFLDRLGHKTRQRMCPLYVAGLIGPGDRKSVQPMAERLATSNYDQLHHFIADGVWNATPLETELLNQADRLVGGRDAVLVIDDTSLPKKGERSVGVAAQYASALGKTANCQTLVSLTLARGEVPVMVALRLFLPDSWTSDIPRLKRARVPVEHRTPRSKPEIALAEIDRAMAANIRFGCVLADAGYGLSAPFRQGLTERGLAWAVGIPRHQKVYPVDVKLIWPITKARGKPRKHHVPDILSIAAEQMLASPKFSPSDRGIQALFQRRYAAAIEIFSNEVAAETKRGEPSYGEKFQIGLSQQRVGDVAAARATWKKAVEDIRRELEKVAPGSPVEANLRGSLGSAYAGLGDAASAIAEGQKAMAMRPTSKDALEGPLEEESMADVYALLGDADHAIPILKRLLQIPYGPPITPALLRLDPVWDQIRNDPRFQELAAEKKP